MHKALLILLFVSIVSAISEYFIPTLKANWYKAREFCNSVDMSLVSIPNKEEHDKLVEIVRNSDKYSDKRRFWIGGSDLPENGTFSWVSTGRMFTFNRWASGRPNHTDETHNCVEMIYWPSLNWDWNWQNSDCNSEKFYFICKRNNMDCISEFR
ncbi:AAEL011453-PA [Aedes aegypti]|uniref:AAEL011453-PA n=1 Tax=Aedes aegypti TaxID=7159 RepID=Q16Q05_AEDAE|nr:AAEL011453-PA [Aedes aegypti]